MSTNIQPHLIARDKSYKFFTYLLGRQPPACLIDFVAFHLLKQQYSSAPEVKYDEYPFFLQLRDDMQLSPCSKTQPSAIVPTHY